MPVEARAREWLDLCRRCWGGGGAVSTRVHWAIRVLCAVDVAQRLRTEESSAHIRKNLLLALIGLLTSVVSLLSGVWCHPNFYVALILLSCSARNWAVVVAPANVIVLGVWRYFCGPISWDDLYQCAVMSLCLIRRWDVSRETFWECEDVQIMAETQAVFNKVFASVFDAWFVCDAHGIFQVSTPQLDVLLGAPGSSPKENALQGFSILELAIDVGEKSRARDFFASAAGSDTTSRITLRLNRRNSTAHQVEVTLSANRLHPQSWSHCMDLVDLVLDAPRRRTHGSSTCSAPEGEILFVAVQVLEAEPLCAVVDSESHERPPAEAAGAATPGSCDAGRGAEARPRVGAELVGGSPAGDTGQRVPSRGLSSFLQKEPRAVRVKNTFVDMTESVADTVFEEAQASLRPCAVSAPGSLVHLRADGSPGASSWRSPRSGSGWSRASPRAARGARAPRPPASERSGSSSPSEASQGELRREVRVSCEVQDRSLLGPGAAAAASLGRALVARREGVRSVGSAGHASGRCYPCLMEVWAQEGKALSPCKFGLFCGRCHEGHSEEQLRELRRRQRQRRPPGAPRRRAQ